MKQVFNCRCDREGCTAQLVISRGGDCPDLLAVEFAGWHHGPHTPIYLSFVDQVQLYIALGQAIREQAT